MWLIVGLIAIAVAWAVFANRKPPRSTGCRETESARREVSVTVWKHDDAPTGKIVTLSKSVAITLCGQGAAEVIDYLSRTANHHEDPGVEGARRRSFELAILMSRHNVESPEVEAWRVAVLKKIEQAVKKDLGSAVATAGGDIPDDKDVYRYEFEDLATEELREHGVPYWIDYEEFAQPRPSDTSADDAMLERLSAKKETLGDLAFYMVHAGSIVQSHQDRSMTSLGGLVEAGYATLGSEAPASELVRCFKLAELRAAIGQAGKVRKKADAAQFLTPDVVAKLPGIERFFYIKPLSDDDMRAMCAFRWMLTHAQLIQVTFRCAEKVAVAAAMNRASGNSYGISGDCCPQSRRERNPSSRLPASLPPYHIACTAELETY